MIKFGIPKEDLEKIIKKSRDLIILFDGEFIEKLNSITKLTPTTKEYSLNKQLNITGDEVNERCNPIPIKK